MEKLVRTSQRLDVFFKVLQRVIVIALAVVVLVMLILSIVNRVNPHAVIGEGFNQVDLGPITLTLEESLAPDNDVILGYVWSMIAVGVVSGGAAYYCLHLIRGILAPMTQGRPFDEGIGRSIRRIGWLSLVLGVIRNIGTIIETMGAVQAFGLSGLENTGMIRSVMVHVTFDLRFLVVFFVLLLISHVFNYGAQLQQLSDETL